MSLSVEIGLLLALGTAFGSVAGFLYKFRGARDAPDVDFRRPMQQFDRARFARRCTRWGS